MNLSLADGAGLLQRYPDFPSDYIPPRHVDVWCPPGSAGLDKSGYPVLYMHDGQNLFDPALSYGGVNWSIHQAMLRLMQESKIRPALIVGIWNSGEGRWRDYMPQKPLETPGARLLRERFIAERGGAPRSDAYLRFLVDELKPWVDRHYRTLPDPADTFVLGSSMGGLISLYALTEYAQVFGGAGCLSTHWPAGGNLLVDALAAALPKPGGHKLYFDFGTATLDAGYEPYQRRMDAHVAAAGYTEGVDWLTKKFPGAEHSERAWRTRVHIPLEFLLGPSSTAANDRESSR